MDAVVNIQEKLKVCQTESERKLLEQQYDEAMRNIDDKQLNYKFSSFDEISDFEYYPDINDPEFNQKIFNKKEFRDHITGKRTSVTSSLIDDMIFRKTPSQNFTANFISENTPYNGILLWHGVGIGKTCTALSIAENFHDYVVTHKKKIIILTPSDTLRETWRNEIFNITKEINKYKKNIRSNVQCTGDRYTKEIQYDWKQVVNLKPKELEETYKKLRKKVNKIINQYYEILGYQMLVNKIENEMKQINIFDKSKPEYERINYIRRRFSNTVIIMDEAHFIRDSPDTEEEKNKLATPYIEMIARYAENTKIILSTATPMYNLANEIIWLLNILLMNDKRATIKDDDIFNVNGSFKEPIQISKMKLVNAAQGYISYVRSENPFDFPLKLEPDQNDIHTYTPNQQIEYYQGNYRQIPKTAKMIKGIKFYKSPMNNYQFSTYLKVINDERFLLGFGTNVRQASDIVFPNIDNINDTKLLIGEKGFNRCITYDKTSKKYVYNGNIEPFLNESLLKNYSSKFSTILECIKKSKGIIFIYSQFVVSGIKTIAMMLEENGFKQRVKPNEIEHTFQSTNNIKKDNDYYVKKIGDDAGTIKKYSELKSDEKQNYSPATYIYLSSETKSILDDLIRVSNNDNNNYGQNVKIILGSPVTGQGLNFKNIREVHIVDPWFHFNSLEQSIGRAIRRGSHNALPLEERNTTIYIHTATVPIDNPKYKNVETTDEHTYRLAYVKAEDIAEVQRLLKENAIDCENNFYGNVYLKDDYENMPRRIRDSRNNERDVNIYDKDNSLICDLRQCLYKCRTKDKLINRKTLLDFATFTPEHQSNKKVIFKEIIKQIFINDMTYDEDSIINEIMKMAQYMGYLSPNINQKDLELNKNIIYQCLTEMINDKEFVYNYEFRPGLINVYKGSYVFTPIELNDMDKNLPLTYRDFPNIQREPKFDDIKEAMCIREKPKLKEIKLAPELEEKEYERKVSTQDMTDINKFIELETMAKNYINKHFSYYKEVPDNKYIPSVEKLIIYKFQSLFESYYSTTDKYRILKTIIIKIFNKHDLHPLEQVILTLYDTPKKNTYIIRDGSNIIGLKEVYIRSDDKKSKALIQNIYMKYMDTELEPIVDEKINEKYKWKPFINNSKQVGWLEPNRAGNEIIFYIFNDIEQKLTGDIKQDLRFRITGAKCKSGSKQQNTSEKEQVADLVKLIRNGDIKDSKPKTRDDLCGELELLLRHRDNIDGSDTIRYFYRMEENDFVDFLRKPIKK
jgi:hypothetical protein